jgi:hypothetical protein
VRPDDGGLADEVGVLKPAHGAGGERVDPFRHVQAAVGGGAGEQGVDERHGGAVPRELIHCMNRSTFPDRTGTGRPSAFDGHEDDLRLVTLIRSPRPAAVWAPHRSASTSTRTVTEVRPIRTVWVKKLTISPTNTGS